MTQAERVLAGEVRAAARLMRDLDDERPGAVDTLRALYPHTGHAFVLGITGHPGAGKSTLTDRLITHYRARNLRVAVLAIDPTSPFTGGAILGDRVRMQRHAADPGVFIRSLATRGVLGGLSASARDIIDVFDAMGFDVVIVETVGVGQDEIDIAHTAHTSVVVTVPGLGDGVQAIKAGLLEIADLFVVNKADHADVERAVRHLKGMLDLEGATRRGWEVPVLRTISTQGHGTAELADAVEGHRRFLATSEEGPRRRRLRHRHALTDRVYATLRRRADAVIANADEDLVTALCAREIDPYTATSKVLSSAARNHGRDSDGDHHSEG